MKFNVSSTPLSLAANAVGGTAELLSTAVDAAMVTASLPTRASKPVQGCVISNNAITTVWLRGAAAGASTGIPISPGDSQTFEGLLAPNGPALYYEAANAVLVTLLY